MKEFALVFRLNDLSNFQPTPEELEERLNWLASIEARDLLISKGNTLLPYPETSRIVINNAESIDGPFTELKEFITGFVLIRAVDITAACKIAMENPIFKKGGSIEVREILQRNMNK